MKLSFKQTSATEVVFEDNIAALLKDLNSTDILLVDEIFKKTLAKALKKFVSVIFLKSSERTKSNVRREPVLRNCCCESNCTAGQAQSSRKSILPTSPLCSIALNAWVYA